MADGLDCPPILCSIPLIQSNPAPNPSGVSKTAQAGDKKFNPIELFPDFSQVIPSLLWNGAKEFFQEPSLLRAHLLEKLRSFHSLFPKRFPKTMEVAHPSFRSFETTDPVLDAQEATLDIDPRPPPEPIRDFRKALEEGDPFAKALSSFVQAFQKEASPDPKVLASYLETLIRDPQFVRLIQSYFREGIPYGRTPFLSDSNLGLDRKGNKIGLEGVAILWKPGQRSSVHHHGSSQGLDIVLSGNGGVEVRYVIFKDQRPTPYRMKRLIPHQANVVKGKHIHQMVNSLERGEFLRTIHFYWPPICKS